MVPFEALYGRRCRTSLCWYKSGESALLGPDVVQETTEKVKTIQEKMRASQSRKKSYHDKRRKDIEFQVSDHMFLRVNPVTGVGRALKCRKLTPRFVGPFEIVEKVRVVAYRIALPPRCRIFMMCFMCPNCRSMCMTSLMSSSLICVCLSLDLFFIYFHSLFIFSQKFREINTT